MNFDKFDSIVEARLHYGELKDATVISEYKNSGCGDSYRLYLKIDNDGIIEKAKYNTTGCSFSMVSLGVLCDILPGKSIDTARDINSQEIERYIDGFPERRKNYIETAFDALNNAINDYQNNTGLDINNIASSHKVKELIKQQGHLRNADLPRVILENEDLSNLDLSDCNLQGAFLKGCNFNHSILKNCNLKGAFLNETDLSGADLSNSDLRFAKLSHANLENTTLNNALYDIGTRIDEKYTHLFQNMSKKGKEIYIK